ncbi:MAG: carboxylating nicotinate-nucleotide diphosphorylase [Acidobacteriota bacterium]
MTHSQYLDNLIDAALKEDIGHGDLTTQLVLQGDERARGQACAKSDFVLAGLDIFLRIFKRLDPQLQVHSAKSDGQTVSRGDVLCEIEGRAAALLTGERVALNFLQHLCGIATTTSMFVAAVRGTAAQVTDTRKTVPTLRPIDKYAVRMGGGRNHRFGLFDGILIKDNHIRIAGGIREAITRTRRSTPQPMPIEIEVATLGELQEGLAEGAELILLDNMTVDQVREAVRINAGRATLEASGGVTLENVRDYALTGVNRISVGALTHSAPAADISFEMALVV